MRTRVVTEYITAKKKVHEHTDIQVNFFIAILLPSLSLVPYLFLLFVTCYYGWWNL